jgi:hypothetical protein
MFICSFLTADGYVNIRIMKNKNEIVRSYAAQSRREEDSGLITVIVDLKQDDQIGVKLVPRWTTGLLRGDLYSIAIGCQEGANKHIITVRGGCEYTFHCVISASGVCHYMIKSYE